MAQEQIYELNRLSRGGLRGPGRLLTEPGRVCVARVELLAIENPQG